MQLNKQLEEVKKEVNRNYVYADEVTSIIYAAIKNNKGLLLYGVGGHAKSEITDAVMAALKIKPFILSCGEGLTVENLFGGLDMKEFKNSGKIHYNVQHSFMNHEVVVFEELLDTPSNVLLELKDVLTRGVFEKGSQQFTSKVKCVIGLTNRTREEYAEDNSVKALLERFPLELKVEWNNYKADNYSHMFERVYKERYTSRHSDFAVLSELAQSSTQRGIFISPRTAVHAADIMLEDGLDSIKYVAGIDISTMEEIKAKREKLEKIRRDTEKLERLENQAGTITNRIYETEDVNELLDIRADLKKHRAVVKEMQVDDTVFTRLADLIKSIDHSMNEVINKLDEISG